MRGLGQEQVEAGEVGTGDAQEWEPAVTGSGGCVRGPGQSLGDHGDGGRVRLAASRAQDDRPFDAVLRMVCQQLQDADVVPAAGANPEPLFERVPQGGERGRQVPIAVDRGVVQRRRLLLQHRQEVQRIEDLLAMPVAASMRRDHLAVGDDHDAIDVPLHTHAAKRPPPRHAVAVVVEADRLVLVHLGRLHNAGVERSLGHGQGCRAVVLEAFPD